MVQEVYIDLYFIVNAGMDFICLALTAALTHQKPRRGRLLLGAGAGGLYACLSLLLGLSAAWALTVDLSAIALCCWLVFWKRGNGVSRFLRVFGVQLLVSAFLGGTMTLLFSWLNRLKLPLESAGSDGLTVWILAILAPLSGFFTLRGGRLLGRWSRAKEVTVDAVLFGKAITLHALVDSGNLLRDPLSGRGVIVADRDRFRNRLPQALLDDRFPTDHSLACRTRLIPVKTAAGDGILRAILPDSLTVFDGKSRQSADYLIAFTSLDDRVEGFDALCPPI